MNVDEMVQNWNVWGNKDPLWSILSDPSKKDGKWDEKEFFATGEQQIGRRLQWLRELGVVVQPGLALDFGCGVGRLTNALAAHFREAHGVDVSPSMIERARQLNRHPDRVKYFHNPKGDLSDFETGRYDFIYTELVLQHIPPRFQKVYIAEFFRLLSPGGVAAFQTIHAVGWRRWIPHWFADFIRRRRSRGEAFIPMYGHPPGEIRDLCGRSGVKVLHYETYPVDRTFGRYWCDVFVVSRPL